MAHPERLIYKVLLSTYIDTDIDDREEWSEFYFDVNTITGFRLSKDKHTVAEDTGVWVYVPGDVFLIKDEPEIRNYLLKHFVHSVRCTTR